MIVVTGGAGFIGSNLIAALNAAGRDDVIVVDDLQDGTKFVNLRDRTIADYYDKDDFRRRLGSFPRGSIDLLLHMGACSSTTEWNGRFMLENNFSYSKDLLRFCQERQVPLIYASSAAVYGASKKFVEDPGCEAPLNVYGYSKLLFDQLVRRRLASMQSQVAGLRFFNVYGPREQHKGEMASVALHCRRQLQSEGKVRLFQGNDGYADGEQRRDFVYVDDVVSVCLWLMNNPAVSGIFNCGTGHSQSFNDVARAAISFYGVGEIDYIPFPEHLAARYQSFTEADITALRGAGYAGNFRGVEEGVFNYYAWLDKE